MKKILLVISIFILLASVVLSVNAHRGNTDGAGGHTNHSTGEYHYHHGYSAHSHYDMDGDGDKDCPYDFDDRTDHNSDKNSGSNTDVSNNRDDIVQHSSDYTYSYIALGFVMAFFIFVNCLALHIDRTDTSPGEEQAPSSSVVISVFSTLIVFVLLFYIMYIFKEPIIWREIALEEMLQILFFSVFVGGIVWLVANWASLLVNALLCKLFKTEVQGWAGSFQRLTIPLSYAFTVLLFILQ